jgi:hypothetical protein
MEQRLSAKMSSTTDPVLAKRSHPPRTLLFTLRRGRVEGCVRRETRCALDKMAHITDGLVVVNGHLKLQLKLEQQ